MVFAVVLLAPPPAPAQVVKQRHVSSPTCWQYGSTTQIVTNAAAWKAAGSRVVDASFIPGSSSVSYARICTALGTGGPYDVDWNLDHLVTEAGAKLLASVSGMRIAALDSTFDVSTQQVVFVSIRESLPPKTQWVWVPATTSAGVQSWLAAITTNAYMLTIE